MVAEERQIVVEVVALGQLGHGVFPGAGKAAWLLQ